MALTVGRCFLVLLLLWEYPDRLAAEMAAASPNAMSSPDEATFAPLALRYREEVVKKISLHSLTPVSNHPESLVVPEPPFSDAYLTARPVLSSLDPVHAFKSLRW